MSLPSGTATAAGARAHARAMAGTRADAMPTVPARAYPDVPDGIDPAALVWAETVKGGGYAARALARGCEMRLRDLDGDACAHVLLFSALGTFERLNVADTVKVPWQAYLTAGHPLLSDQGRALAMIVADSGGAHDALCGTLTVAACAERYGDGAAHGSSPAGRALLELAAAKHGLDRRDLAPTVSFFKGVRVDPDGALRFLGAPGGPGATVTLRAEMPLVVLIANAPHPLDPRPAYTCTRLEVLAWRSRPTWPEDPLWSTTPELERALLNTTEHLAAQGLV